jgi:hypothetical protein
MESPVTVTYIDAPESWEGVAAAVHSMCYSLEGNGFAVTSVVGGTSEEGGLQLTAEFETLDPCPAKARDANHLSSLLANAREGVVEMLLPPQPKSEGSDMFLVGAAAEWKRIRNTLTGRIKRGGPQATLKAMSFKITEVDDDGNEVPSLLSIEEQALLRSLGECNARYRKIIGDSDEAIDHLREWTVHMNDLQSRVMARAAARAYPEQFRLLGDPDKGDGS